MRPNFFTAWSTARVGLRLVGDVQLENLQVLAGHIAQGIAHLLDVPAGGDDAIAGLQRGLGSAGADTAARARDEPDFAHDVFLGVMCEV